MIAILIRILSITIAFLIAYYFRQEWLAIYLDGPSKFNGYGFVNYLDIKSIVKKEEITYFNWNTRLTKPNGTLVDTDFNISKKGGRINCKDKTVYLGNSFKSISSKIGELPFAFWSEVLPIVCEKNKPKWKFW